MKKSTIQSLRLRRSALSLNDSSANMVTDQILKGFIHPSPQSAAFSRYGEYAVDHSTGVPKIEIPLYTLDTGDFKLPISLSYHAGGIKVMDVSSPVGLGWSLVAGGVINRTACAVPDKSSNQYRLLFKNRADVMEKLNTPGLGPGWWKRIFTTGSDDSETDRYSYSFPGKSGIFRYESLNGAIHPVPHNGIQISETDGGYKIVDSDGTQYFFEAVETSGPMGTAYQKTAWYLTRIITWENHNEINFSYSQGQQYVVRYRSEVYEEGVQHEWDDSVTTGHIRDSYLSAFDSRFPRYAYFVPRLNSITWNNVTVNFTYATDRLDAQKERLTTITVTDNGQRVRRIALSNNQYFGSTVKNYRLRLASLSISGSSNSPSETYTFSYDSTTPPNHYNFNINSNLTGLDRYSHEDYWGYYNGRDNEHLIPDGLVPGLTTANRSAYQSTMKMCSLTGITYPTGGRTEFNMESNRVGSRLIGGLRVASICSYEADGTLLEKRSYSYENAVENIPLNDDLFTYYDDVWYYFSHIGSGVPMECLDEEHYFAASNPILPLTGWSGSPVFYGKVTEYVGGTTSDNLGKNVYYYMQDFESSYPDSDEDLYALPLHMRFYSTLYCNDEGNVPALLTRREVHKRNADGTYRLQLLEQTSYAQMMPDDDHYITGVKLAQRGFGFTSADRDLSDTCAPFPSDAAFYYSIVYSNTLAYRCLRLPVSRSVTVYGSSAEASQASGVTTVTQWTYDPHLTTLLPLTESFTNSDGLELRTEYQYAFQRSESVYSAIAGTNNLDLRVKETLYYGGERQRIRETSYTQLGIGIRPFYVKSDITETLGPGTPGSGNTRVLASFDRYERSNGKLLHFSTWGGHKHTILWGYGYRYPVIHVEGLEYDEMTDHVDTATVRLLANCTASNAETLISGVRTSLAQIAQPHLTSSWIFRPGIGPSCSVAPSGARTDYLYDALGRLSKVSDDQGEIESYTYAFASGSGSSWVPNLVRRRIKRNASSSDPQVIESVSQADGIGRPLGNVIIGGGGSGYNLLSRIEYDLSGRQIREWLPVRSTSEYLSPSAFLSEALSLYGNTDGARAFSETVFEKSAMDRAEKTYGPGAAWYPGHPVSTEWLCNTGTAGVLSCRRYTSGAEDSETIVDNGFYANGQLMVTHVTDEDGNSAYTFTDKAGRVILERRMSSSSVAHDTYYIYNRRGNLRFVLQPKYQEEASIYKYAFRYRYDYKDNCLWKGTPGADSVQMEYDEHGRLIFSRTGVQSVSGKWTYNTYDNLGRLLTSGENTSKAVGGTQYIRNWYDGYAYGSGEGFSSPPYPTSGAWCVGKLTGQKVAVLSPSGLSLSDTKVCRSFEYDSRGQVVRTVANNPVSSSYGFSVMTNVWTHTGKLATASTVHAYGTSGALTVVKTYAYDQLDRLTRISQSVGGGSSVVIADYVYDTLGRLQTRKLGGSSTANLTQTLSYDIRSALTGLSNGRFAQTLVYANASTGKGYGGNVTSMNWGAGPSAIGKTYAFNYDGLGRLLSAVYSGSGSNRNETITGYDLNGNIQGIIRDGWDTVSMSYSGNRLTSVGGSTCGYDADGRFISDARKGITAITYTSAGFPQKITFSDGSTIMYAYTADGARLRSKHSGGGITRDWCGEAMYEGGVRKMILNEEGYIDCTASNAMRFYVKDHLGSVRAVLNSSGTVLESCDYYPLGGQFNASSGQVQPYKFSGKELDTYKNINTLDFGARTYDPSIGRWLTQDPMAEKYYNLSPYNYCAGNPVRYVDPDGMDWYSNNETGEKIWQAGNQAIEGYENIGPTFEEEGYYYSLFGSIVPKLDEYGNPIGELYKDIDRFITKYVKSQDYEPQGIYDQDFPSSETVFDISGSSFNFVYQGKDFCSEKDGTIFRPTNSTIWRGQHYQGDNTLIMRLFPSGGPRAYGGYATNSGDKRWNGYWIVGESKNKIGHPLQILFDETNARKFLQVVNKQLRNK